MVAQREKRPNILFAISDDQSWLHTSAAGDPVVKTPHFDRVASTGVRFTHAFCSSPSCTPSRGAILTGQQFFRLEEGGNLWSTLPEKFPVYTTLLEKAGYHVGLQGKGWGPGDFKVGGYTQNPAGKGYKSFEEFLGAREKGKPFCYWFGSQDPHRPYDEGSGVKAGLRIDDVKVPGWLPDTKEVRSDILDYLLEIQRFDRDFGAILERIEKAGELENTLVVVTSDNGMPFPRAKTNLYDSGTRMPLAISWPAQVPAGRVVHRFVSHCDYAPTFLDAAGIDVPREMRGESLLSLLRSKGSPGPGRDGFVVTGRERHTNMRGNGLSYPMRAIRTSDYLYIRNYAADRWPSADPPHYGDIDNGPAKEEVIRMSGSKFFEAACGKRPGEELYVMQDDPWQMNNVAGDAKYATIRKQLSDRLTSYLKKNGDPRETGGPVIWDSSAYYGPGNAVRRPGL